VSVQGESRVRLSRERVLRAAVQLADENGIASLTMRRLADALGAEAMSLYYHVANKEEVLDGVVDTIASEINDVVERLDQPAQGAAWRAAMRRRILAAREVFLRHRWAPQVFESRTNTSLEVLRYYDGVVGLMNAGGFTHDQIHHALHALGSRALGFTQELFDPGSGPGGDEAAAAMASLAPKLPHLVGMLTEISHDDPGSTLGWCDDQTEFEFGLDIVLDGLDRMRPPA
jgi:AcrR family transcriptional regulator